MKTGLPKRGFTLIEILVVLSIISILSTILYASFGEAKIDSKNKAFRSEMKEVQLALELYKAQNGQYPDVPPSPCGSTGAGISSALSTNNVCIVGGTYITGLKPDFIEDLPNHTKSANPNCVVEYKVSTDFSWYKLTAINCLGGAATAAEGVQPDDEFARCLSTCPAVGICDPDDSGFYESYAVYSSGGQCE